MDERLQIISNAALKFHDSGRASTTAEARCIMGALEDAGYVIIKKEIGQPTLDEILNTPIITEHLQVVKVGSWYLYQSGNEMAFVYITSENKDFWTCFGLFRDPIDLTKEWVKDQQLSKKAYQDNLIKQSLDIILRFLIDIAIKRESNHIQFALFNENKLQLKATHDKDMPSMEWDILMEDGVWNI